MFKRTVERLLAILLVLMLAIPALAEDMEIIYQPVDENIELSNELELVEEEPETVDSAELDGTAYLLDDGERPEESEIEESGENNPEIESQEKPAEIPEIKDNGELIEGEVSVPEIGQDAKEPSETEADEGDSEYESVKEVIENTENQPEDVEAEDAEGQSEGEDAEGQSEDEDAEGRSEGEDAEGRSEGEDATEESAKDETAQEDENSTSEVSDDPEDSGEWLSTNVEHIDDEIELDTLYEDESAKLMEAGSLLAANTVNYEYLPSILMVGDVYDLTKCLLIDGYEPSDVVSWKSSKKKVVRISKSGMLTALKTGKAKITVRTSDKKKRTISVSVRANSIGGLFPKPSKGEAIALGEAFSIQPKSLRYSGTKLVAEFYLLNGSKKAMKTIRGLNLSVFAGSRTNKITNQYFSKIKVKGKKKGVSTFKVTFSGSGILQNNVHLSDYPASQIYFDLTVPSVDGTVKRGTIPFVATVIPNVPAPVYVSGISLSTGALSLSVGNSTQLAASVQPDNAENKAINWSSSNSGVASVDGSGRVTAVSAGTATITVTAADGSGVSASCVVTVADPNVEVKAESLTLDHTSVNVYVGDTVTITSTLLPINTSEKTLNYNLSPNTYAKTNRSSTNGNIGTFVVEGVKEGQSVLKVASKSNPKIIASCTINVLSRPSSTLPTIKSVSMPSQVSSGSSVKIIIETQYKSDYIAMYNSSGAQIKSWKYNDTGVSYNGNKSADTATWTITHTFTGTANTKYTYSFRASQDNTNFGSEKSASITITSTTGTVTTVSGNFTKSSDTVTIGEKYYLKGAASVKNGTLGTVTINVLNHGASDYPYSEVTKTFNSRTSIKLENYSNIYVFDTSKKPFNTPGTYTINLHVKATDGTYKKVDSMKLTTINKEQGYLVSSNAPTLKVSTGKYSNLTGSDVGGNLLKAYYLKGGDTFQVTANTTNCGRITMTGNIVKKNGSDTHISLGNGSVTAVNPTASQNLSLTLGNNQQPGVYEINVYASNSTKENDTNAGVKKAQVKFYIYVHGNGTYNASKAIEYAKKWAKQVSVWTDKGFDASTWNPGYVKHTEDGGQDCSNFVSQCLFAGGLKVDSTWNIESGAWTYTHSLKSWLDKKFVNKDAPIKYSDLHAGDILFTNNNGHVVIVTAVSSNDFAVAAHTNDRNDWGMGLGSVSHLVCMSQPK